MKNICSVWDLWGSSYWWDIQVAASSRSGGARRGPAEDVNVGLSAYRQSWQPGDIESTWECRECQWSRRGGTSHSGGQRQLRDRRVVRKQMSFEKPPATFQVMSWYSTYYSFPSEHFWCLCLTAILYWADIRGRKSKKFSRNQPWSSPASWYTAHWGILFSGQLPFSEHRLQVVYSIICFFSFSSFSQQPWGRCISILQVRKLWLRQNAQGHCLQMMEPDWGHTSSFTCSTVSTKYPSHGDFTIECSLTLLPKRYKICPQVLGPPEQ